MKITSITTLNKAVQTKKKPRKRANPGLFTIFPYFSKELISHNAPSTLGDRLKSIRT
ncbi:hypothetical protein HanIR_Chr17g0855371 [Helianthus annuus]|nr:hypothetical protein HanIR_Chr17g0855371 [Helianthus annuus]